MPLADQIPACGDKDRAHEVERGVHRRKIGYFHRRKDIKSCRGACAKRLTKKTEARRGECPSIPSEPCGGGLHVGRFFVPPVLEPTPPSLARQFYRRRSDRESTGARAP